MKAKPRQTVLGLAILLMLAANSVSAEIVPPRWLVPVWLYGQVGRELNVYFDAAFAPGDHPGPFRFEVDSGAGRQFNDRWQLVPATTNRVTVVFSAYCGTELLATATAKVQIGNSHVPAGRRVHVLGDSTLAEGSVLAELKRLGGPETRGSKSTTRADSTGTLQTFHHEAVPNRTTGDFGFLLYQDVIAFVHLGINDMIRSLGDEEMIEATEAALDNLEGIVTKFRLIALSPPIPPALEQDAFGSMKGSGISRWRYKRNRDYLCAAILDRFANRSKIWLVPMHLSVDPDSGFPWEEKPWSSRNSAPRPVQTDPLHPSPSGSWQMADALHSFFAIALLNKQ